MPRFRLRYNQQERDLPALGEVVAGRGTGCDILLDDPLASRRHALFETRDGKLYVEDLGSRNGVTVNDVKIKGRAELSPNDVVVVANHSFRVLVADGPAQKVSRRMAVTLPTTLQEQPTALGIRAALIGKAFAVGRIEDVEAILESYLNTMLGDLRRQNIDMELLAEVTRYSLRLANETGKFKWFDWVFQLYHVAGKVLPAATVDELYVTGRKNKQPVTTTLRDYLDWLHTRSEHLSATERFVVQRIEGLVRSLTA